MNPRATATGTARSWFSRAKLRVLSAPTPAIRIPATGAPGEGLEAMPPRAGIGAGERCAAC